VLGGLVAHLEPAVVEQLLALIGRDPRQMTVPELNALGHEKQPLLQVIRTNCIECVGGIGPWRRTAAIAGDRNA